MDDEDFLDDMLAEEEAMEAERAAEAEAARFAVAQEYDPGMFEDGESSRSSAGGGVGGTQGPDGTQQRRRLVQDDDDEEDGEEDGSAAGGSGALKDAEGEDDTGSMGPAEEPQQDKKAALLSARARLLSERLGKEGTRRRREALAEEMEALPGMDCDDWRDKPAATTPGGAKASSSQQQQQQQKRRHLLLASLRQSDTDTAAPNKGSKAGKGAGGGAGLGGIQMLATVPRSAPHLGERAKEKGELLSRPPAEGGCATIVTGTGDLCYLKKRASADGGDEGGSVLLPLAARRALLNAGGGSSTSSSSSSGSGGMGLLSLPMAELKRRVEKRRYARKVLQRAVRGAPKPPSPSPAAAATDDAAEEEQEAGGDKMAVEGQESRESTPSMKSPAKAAAPAGGGKSAAEREREQLWVHRYSPSAFAHLLSDEAINREVLRLVRSWDEFVFKRALPKTLLEPTTTTHSSSSSSYGHNKEQSWKERKKQQEQERGQEKEAGPVDPAAKRDRRPKVRAILLCGPPGMGKTTLAHVVAQHCGYRPFEINASDDRSAPVLREKITRAMQSQAVLGDKRPNCIILDEADGIDGKTGIKLLVDMIKAPLASAASKDGKGKKSGDESSSVPPLTRPIICICNDLYAPQLRALREVAAVFRFRRTSSTRLLQRLKTICHAEALPLEGTALGALAEASGNDVRACLNALQLFKARIPALLADSSSQLQGAALSARLSRELLAYIGKGLKDQERDLLQVCNAVFRRPSTVRPHSATAAAKANARAQEEQERRAGADVDELLHLTSGAGGNSGLALRVKDTEVVMRAVAAFADHPQVLQALHENFLQLRYTDPTLAKTALASEWLAFSDLIQGRQMEAQHHIMEDLHLATGAALHLLCRGDMRPRIQLPRRDYEYRLTKQSRQHILQSFQEGCLQYSGALWARQAGPVVLDVLSPLMEILNPSLRAKNPDLYTLAEKVTLRHLVEVMLGCGISYVQIAQQHHHHASSFGAHQQQQQQPMHLEMVPALDQLVIFGRATEQAQGFPNGQQQQQQQMMPLRVRTTHVLPNFVKLVATQEAKLEAMKRAEARKAELMRAKAKLQQQKQQWEGQAGGAMPPPPSPAPAAKRASPSPASVGGKKPKLELHKKLVPIAPPALDDDDDAAAGKGPRGWFQKLGTKRSTKGAGAAAAAAAAKKKREEEEAEKGAEGLDGKENKGKEGVGSKAVVRFKYQAGYTNAIRRPVFLKDML